MFRKASKSQSRLRLALMGPSGSGKTYSSLAIATALGKTAVIDTEHGSSEKYAGIFDFDVCELTSFHPNNYIEAIKSAEQGGYDVLVIDSMSHAWMGKDGLLEQVDRIAKRSSSGNSFGAWKDANPMLAKLIEAILASPLHVIASFRTKTEWVIEKDDRGKNVPRKVGTASIFKDGVEYEMDVVADMNQDNEMIVTKSRCPELSGQIIQKPGADVAKILRDWVTDGAPAAPKVDRDALMAESGKLMAAIGWSAKDGKAHLEEAYGKSSRQFLADDELVGFVQYLKSAPQLVAEQEPEPELEIAQ